LDEDDSGSISLDEIRATLKKLNRAVSEEEIYGVMRSLDIDDSDAVDFEEFKHIFEMSDSTREKNARY
jgi:calcium-dependent protein kinase